MKTTPGHRACPVCRATEADAIRDIKFSLFEGHPMQGGYVLVQCIACGFVYADTPVTQNQLDDYYKDLSKYEDKQIGTGGGYTAYDKDRLAATADFLDNCFPDKNIRVVDLGCANGGLLRELKARGFTNLVGVDPSPVCTAITREEAGCPTYSRSLFDSYDDIGQFDLVILSHVLEHILDVQSAVASLSRMLPSGGCVYIECPDAEKYACVIHAPFQEFNTEHINHFTKRSFENLFGLSGFDPLFTGGKSMAIASGQEYFAVYGLFKKTGTAKERSLVHDDEIIQAIREYIRKSDEIYEEILGQLESLGSSKVCALYGIGQFAFKLMSEPVLGERKELLLFDNNSLNVGKVINGHTIRPGREIASVGSPPDSIIITSLIHEKGIREQIGQAFSDKGGKVPEIIGFQNLVKEQQL